VSARAEGEWERVAAAGRLRARGRFSLVAVDQLFVCERFTDVPVQFRLGGLFRLEETLGFELQLGLLGPQLL